MFLYFSGASLSLFSQTRAQSPCLCGRGCCWQLDISPGLGSVGLCGVPGPLLVVVWAPSRSNAAAVADGEDEDEKEEDAADHQ